MRWPLRRQIMLPMAAIMLLTVVVLGGVGAVLSVRATRAHIATRIEGVSRILEESNFPLTDAVLRQMNELSGAELAVVDRRDQIVSTSDSAIGFAAMIAAAPPADGRPFELGTRSWIRNAGYFHTVVPLAGRGTDDRAATLHIFYPEADYRRAWQRAIYPSLAFIVVALPVVMLLAGLTASRIARRMNRLQGQVDRIARGEFQQFELTDRDDEIRALGQAVNRMAVMLARYEDDVRRTERMRTLAHLGGGIAHQLRNSATGCNIALDLHAEECPIADDCESLGVAKRQLQLMEEYLQRFLQLGKPSEERGNKTIDVAKLIDELLPLVQPAARHANVTIEWNRPDGDFSIAADAAALSQLVINLLVNAIEAAEQEAVRSGTPGQVAVELSPGASPLPNPPGRGEGAGRVSLTISDSGAGPPAEIGDAVFEPFVTAKTDGVGLGLSVAHDVVTRHGGTIRWSRINGMTVFSVELPCEQMEMQCA
jgi:signal transduction histidine kinase